MQNMPQKVPSLKQGEKDLYWAHENMQIIDQIIKRYKNKDTLEGYSLGICLHITKETAVLILGLKQLGANIFICPANPLSTQEHIVSSLKEKGINVYSNNGKTMHLFYKNMESVLENKPHIIVDDGGEFHKKALQKNYKVLG